jgi:hypothetical protein
VRAERIFPLIVAAVLACEREDRSADVAAGHTASGPDPIALRVPRLGGPVRAYLYPDLDSTVWRSAQPMPPIDRLLAFDQENGVIAFADEAGSAGWLDLRLGTVQRSERKRLGNVLSADGWSIFGIASDSSFVRTTPSGDWTFVSERRVRRLFPLPDGSLVLLGGSDVASSLFRLRPPEETITDSVTIPAADRAASTLVGDRLYISAGRTLFGVAPNEIASRTEYRASDEILAIAPTPSGDRVFIAQKGSERLEVVNRYSGDLHGSVRLPGFATELRMDPVGRFLLARPAAGDSVWIVDLGIDRLVGTLASGWRNDLPSVAVDGRIAVLRGPDVFFIDPAKGPQDSDPRVKAGASDYWFFTRWNGFRPRARGIDVPVSFRIANDPGLPTPVTAPPTAADTTPTTAVEAPAVIPPAPVPAAGRSGWTVSFAAVLSPERANEIAKEIVVDGANPRIAIGETAGTRVYRVILGPYPTREDAERVGRAARHSYWIYEAVP